MWLQAGVLQAAPLALALLWAHLLMSAEAYSCSPSAKGLEWCFTLQWWCTGKQNVVVWVSPSTGIPNLYQEGDQTLEQTS